MTTLAPIDNRWYSAHQPILFGADSPFYQQGYTNVFADSNGNAVFSRLSIYPYPDFVTQMYIPDGIYSGWHTITGYDSITDTITTTTTFIANDPTPPQVVRTFYPIVPFGYRVHMIYDSQISTFDLRAFHKQDGTAYVDVSSVLANIFELSPPTNGYDDKMYCVFAIEYIPLGDFADFLNTYSLNINTFTGWNYILHIYYALNSAIPHTKLQTLIANNDWICTTSPVFSGDCCNVMTKLVNNRAYNYIVCPSGVGIGSMEIENTFIIN